MLQERIKERKKRKTEMDKLINDAKHYKEKGDAGLSSVCACDVKTLPASHT